MTMIFEPVIKQLQSDEPLLIMGHFDPDPDAVSSMLAIYQAFDGARKGWKLRLQDAPSDNVCFLPCFDEIKVISEEEKSAERLLLVDCNSIDRAVRDRALLPDIKTTLIIDHHIYRGAENENSIIDPAAAACCELIFDIICRAGVAIDQELALTLYTGIAGDTGCFRQANTTARTLSAGAKLLETGFDPAPARINLFERRTQANIKILGKALNEMECFFDNRLCFMTASLEDKRLFGASNDDCTSIVSYALHPVGALIGVFFEGREDGCVKISFRSRGAYTINGIAEALGGGGHALAAGATVRGDLPAVKQQVLDMLRKEYFEA